MGYSEKLIQETTDSGSPDPTYLTQSTRQPAVKLTGDIHYIGNHCYAYGGRFDMSTSRAICLAFTTNSNAILATFQCNAGQCSINNSCVGGGGTSSFDIIFNDIEVAKLKAEGAREDMDATARQVLVIPPYTSVNVRVISDSADSSYDTTVNMVGEVI